MKTLDEHNAEMAKYKSTGNAEVLCSCGTEMSYTDSRDAIFKGGGPVICSGCGKRAIKE